MIMFRRNRQPHRHRQARVVDNGIVSCSRSTNDVDIDRCYFCPAFEDLVEEGSVSYLTCRPATRMGMADQY
jgi:hypothetical protein